MSTTPNVPNKYVIDPFKESTFQGRLLTAWPLILFGVSEQLVYLLLTIAQGLTFISFGVAILFAFFKKTEVIARSIIDLWIELLIQTVVIALIQALVVSFFLTGTTSGNGIVVLGIGLLCLIFMVIVLFSGLKAVWNSFNRLFNAFGQVTGGAVISPGAATIMTAAGAVGAAGLAAVATGTVVGVGSSALAGATALHHGATPAQAAGLTFGGLKPLADATRTLTRLPGLRATPLGEAAAQFSEGAATRHVADQLPGVGRALGPLVGAKLLTDYDPAQAEVDAQGRLVRRPMLVPAVGAGLERLTYPLGKQPIETTDEGSDLLPGFTPINPKRMGWFTPVAPADAPDETQAREQERYAAEMRGEELEQHITEVTQSRAGTDRQSENETMVGAAGRLERSAEALQRAAGTLTGSLRLTGTADVTGVLGDVMRLLGGRGGNGVDHLTAGALIAQAVGITPLSNGQPPFSGDLTRFGLFIDQAARLGLSPEQTERVGQEVGTTPDRRLTPDTRRELVDDAITAGRWRDEAEHAVNRLEIAARLLPTELTVQGELSLPTPAAVPELINAPLRPVTPAANPELEAALRASQLLAGSGQTERTSHD